MRNRLILFVILVAALTGMVGFWYYQRNIYSKEVLKLEILGPEAAELAQEIEYTVKYKNNGNIKLEDSRLVFKYPDYSLIEERESLRQELILGDIYPGAEKTFHFKAGLLGKEGDIKTAQAWLSYRPKNLKARYESETSHAIQIKSVPLILEFDLPSKIESGKEISFRLNYFSNVNYPLSNLGIKVTYPPDFEFKSASPKTLEKTDWEVGLLNKAEGGRIEIMGNLTGEIGEQKNFRAQLGTWQDGEFVLLKEVVRAVQIIIPALYITQEINSNPQYVASPGDTLHYEVFFKNIGEEAFSNLFLVAKLEGQLFDFPSLKAPSGEFEPGDNSIIFDWRRIPKLRFLDAQEEGKIEFWIGLKNDWEIATPQDKNPVLRNKVYLSQARQEFLTKVNSKLEIIQKGYYEDEIFGNSGPIPPEVGKTTTYTITWQGKNYYNDVKNLKVEAVLGKDVDLTGKIFPEGARLTFDSTSREVVWKMETLHAGKGILEGAPNISFQLSFVPTSSQVGTTPTLIGKALISGEDQFTSNNIQGISSAIDTTLPDDDTVSISQGVVQ